jgi:hypothetical protein
MRIYLNETCTTDKRVRLFVHLKLQKTSKLLKAAVTSTEKESKPSAARAFTIKVSSAPAAKARVNPTEPVTVMSSGSLRALEQQCSADWKVYQPDIVVRLCFVNVVMSFIFNLFL